MSVQRDDWGDTKFIIHPSMLLKIGMIGLTIAAFSCKDARVSSFGTVILSALLSNGGDDRPSLSTSGETLTIEESMFLRARTEQRRDVGEEHEWSQGCG